MEGNEQAEINYKQNVILSLERIRKEAVYRKEKSLKEELDIIIGAHY